MRSAFLSALALAAGCNFVIDGVAPEDGATVGDLATGSGVDGAMIDASAPGDMVMVVSGRKKSITFDKTKVSGTQTEFPVWIDLTDSDVGARARADGHDIYFTAANGTTALDYEIQHWDAAAHHLTAWVRVPTLDAATSTVIYLRYGAATTATPNAPGVFKSSFAAVWHLDDAIPATSIADATGTHAGVPTLLTTTQVGAKLGGGLAFTGGTDTITFTNPLMGNAPHTISVWVNQPAVTHASSVLVVGSPSPAGSRWFYTHFMSAVMAVGYYNPDWTTETNLDNAGWTLVHWVYEGGNGRNRIYQNGVEVTGSPNTMNGVNTTGATGVIGHAPEPAYGTNMGLQATIDELRIATAPRTPGWIATEYANQSSPATFYAVGAEELAP